MICISKPAEIPECWSSIFYEIFAINVLIFSFIIKASHFVYVQFTNANHSSTAETQEFNFLKLKVVFFSLLEKIEQGVLSFMADFHA